MNSKGLLIAVEGIDGSGKTTLAQNLYRWLQDNHYKSILTKEPGGTPLGRHIRTILQEQTVTICPKAEYLLFAADRAQHMQELIIPALHDNTIVLSDRMGDSSLIYQGHTRGLDMHMIEIVNQWALCNKVPDITIFVHLDPEIAYERCIKRSLKLSAFEKESKQFMRTVSEGFCALYKNRDNVIQVAGDQSPEDMLEQTYKAIMPWLKKF